MATLRRFLAHSLRVSRGATSVSGNIIIQRNPRCQLEGLSILSAASRVLSQHANTNDHLKRPYSTAPDQGSKQSEYGQLVYVGPSNSSVKLVKYFSLSTSALGILAQPYLISQMASNGMIVKVSIAAFTAFFVLGTPFLLHFICKRYVTRMYFDKDSKTFTVVRLNFFAREKYLSFHPEELNDSMPSPLSNYQVGPEAILLDTNILRETDPEAYIAFKRYDQPIDLDKYVTRDPAAQETAETKRDDGTNKN